MDKKTEAQLSLVIHKAHLESSGVETHIKVYVSESIHLKKKFFLLRSDLYIIYKFTLL